MPLVSWQDEYETGDVQVDKQHKALFAMVNALHNAIVERRTQDIMGDILNTLERYVAQHFAAENRLMDASGYPELEKHRTEHQALADKAGSVIADYRNGRLVLGVTVSQFLGKWLTEHILIEDKKMIQWIQAHKDVSGSHLKCDEVADSGALPTAASGQ